MKIQSKVVLVIVALLCLSAFMFSAPEEAKKCPGKVKVQVAEIQGGNFSEFAHFDNEIVPVSAELNAAVDGKIKEVLFKAGDWVKSGDVLVTLDSAALAKGLKEATADVTLWEKTLRARKNWKDKNEKAVQQAEEKLRQAREKLAAQQDVLAKYSVKSAMDGQIEKLAAEAGMDVIAGALLAVVSNDSTMKFSIAGEEISSLTDKEKVFVRFEKLSSGMNGEVNLKAANQADILLDNSDKKLERGLVASMKILKKEYSDAIVLNQDQIVKDAFESAYVFLAENGRAKKALLSLGAAEDGRVLVLAGLEKGGQLIVSDAACLKDGKKIKIVNPIAAVAPVKAEKAVEVKKEEVPEVKKEEAPPVQKEAMAGAAKKFKVGLNLVYQYMTAEGFSGLYGRAVGPGIELSYLVGDKIDIWVSASTSSKKKTLSWSEDTTKYSMMPISAGIKYYVLQKEKMAAFVGGGLNYVVFKNTDPFGEVKENVFGFNVLGGANFKLSNAIQAQAQLMFNSGKKTIDMTPEADFPLDLSNVALKVGVFYAF